MIRTRVVFPPHMVASLINGIVECAQGVSLQCIPIDPNQSFTADVNQNILKYPKNILKCAQGVYNYMNVANLMTIGQYLAN